MASIATLLKPVLAIPGELVVRKGEPGDAMYFISSGVVDVRLDTGPVRLGNDDFFGEIALVSHVPRTADVVTRSFCNLLVLYARDFKTAMKSDPELKRVIEETAATRLIELNKGR